MTTRNGRSVFASSVAPKGKASVASRRGLGELWSGFDRSAAASPSASAAQADTPEQGSGLGSTIGVGLAILGLGLAGLFGSFLVAALRRRRAQSEDNPTQSHTKAERH